MIKILLADDHTLVRQGLIQVLQNEPDIQVVEQASDGEEAVAKARQIHPDIVLMDIHMPRLNGIEATRKIAASDPDVGVIILTMYGDEDHLFEAVKAGAKGYLLKNANAESLLETIRAIARGEAWLDPSMALKMLRSFREPSSCDERAIHLTQREREILELLSQGASNQQIAARLQIAEKTVRNRLSLIFSKLHVNNRTQAALKAQERGWVEKKE